jgi:hypothetical protein
LHGLVELPASADSTRQTRSLISHRCLQPVDGCLEIADEVLRQSLLDERLLERQSVLGKQPARVDVRLIGTIARHPKLFEIQSARRRHHRFELILERLASCGTRVVTRAERAVAAQLQTRMSAQRIHGVAQIGQNHRRRGILGEQAGGAWSGYSPPFQGGVPERSRNVRTRGRGG